MSPTERNELRAKLLRMAERERLPSLFCAVHNNPPATFECRECFDALAAVALARTSGEALLGARDYAAGLRYALTILNERYTKEEATDLIQRRCTQFTEDPLNRRATP